MRAMWKPIPQQDGTTKFEYIELWKGWSTKHYMESHLEFQEFYQVKYPTSEEATKYVWKILKHFKAQDAYYSFDNYSNGTAYGGKRMAFPKSDITLGMICHEIAHLLAFRKWKKCCHHNKKFQTQNRRVCRWAKRYLPKPIEKIDETKLLECIQECNLV